MVKPATAPCRQDHDHDLRAPAFLGGGRGPAVLKRMDQDFVTALLSEMGTEGGRAKIRASLAGTQPIDRDKGNKLRLWQPVHRVFHLAVLEAACSEFGGLRLHRRIDPRRIEGTGLVVRRIVRRERRMPDGSVVVDEVQQGWMRQDDAVAGWRDLNGREADQDPDPERRPLPLRAGIPAVTARLRELRPLVKPFTETVHPLFVAPPPTCEAASSTLLYGVIPLTSGEQTEQLPPPPVVDAAGINAVVPEFLLPLPRVRDVQETPGRTFEWSLPMQLKTLPPADPEQGDFLARQQDLATLHQLGAFDDTPEGRALMAHLNQVAVWDELPNWDDVPLAPVMAAWNPAAERGIIRFGTTPWGPLPRWTAGSWPMPDRRLGDVLRDAARIFEESGATGILPRPVRWRLPRGAAWHRELRARLEPLLNRRVEEMTAGVGRYDRTGATYVARAFVRVKGCDECPPELIWSAPTAPFTIVPWFEPSGAPPVRVQLPEARPESFAKLKPNVAFTVPASLQSVLAGLKVKKPLDVEKGDVNLSMDWLCGFNIPIITLCAFIVLSIFLSLLNIIFWWLPLVKICIPIPKSSSSERL
jgi:hypothetical protein